MDIHGRLEITTVIGCTIGCKFCPQKLLSTRYRLISNLKKMSFETYVTCLETVPEDVPIFFAGMAEPWVNESCTAMVLYAAQKGHSVAVYTTLKGMTKEDFFRIKDIPFLTFMVHIPDNLGNSRIHITPDYLDLLSCVFENLDNNGKRNLLDVSIHGPVHQDLMKVVPVREFIERNHLQMGHKMIDRAGHLDIPELQHRVNHGAIMCGRSSRLMNDNILLPNGDVLLCCMDYGMDHVIGNLLKQDYYELFETQTIKTVRAGLDDPNIPILCRKCHDVVCFEDEGFDYRQFKIKLKIDKIGKKQNHKGGINQQGTEWSEEIIENIQLADHLVSAGQFAEALVSLQNALQKCPNDPWLLSAVGNVLFVLERYDEAQELLFDSLSIDFENEQVFINLASSFISKGDIGTGRQVLIRGFKILKEKTQLMHYLLNISPSAKDLNELINYLTNRLEQEPENLDLLMSKASISVFYGNFVDAMRQFQKALIIDPENQIASTSLQEIEMTVKILQN